MIKKATKKPVEIKWLSFNDLFQIIKEKNLKQTYPKQGDYDVFYTPKELGLSNDNKLKIRTLNFVITIETLEGTMNMTEKDVLIIGVQGEIYPCKKDIFEKTYDY